MLFERIEKQHGRILVFHALAYITAAKSGLSESELEDLISLDDKVLDDVYQYHLPPVRRIPPLLWTRIRNDLPNYLSEREADGVNVMNWYHRQFRDTARERYFKNLNMAHYFHSSIADYYLGIWGGGKPKPFKFTEIQRHRFVEQFHYHYKKKLLDIKFSMTIKNLKLVTRPFRPLSIIIQSSTVVSYLTSYIMSW